MTSRERTAVEELRKLLQRRIAAGYCGARLVCDDHELLDIVELAGFVVAHPTAKAA